jgi:hypothetical protein
MTCDDGCMAFRVDEAQHRRDMAALSEGFCPDDGARLGALVDGALCPTCGWTWWIGADNDSWHREKRYNGGSWRLEAGPRMQGEPVWTTL